MTVRSNVECHLSNVMTVKPILVYIATGSCILLQISRPFRLEFLLTKFSVRQSIEETRTSESSFTYHWPLEKLRGGPFPQRNLLVFMSPFSANQHTLKGNNITILKIKTLLRIFIKLELPLELQYFEFACHHFSFKKEIFLWTTCSKKS